MYKICISFEGLRGIIDRLVLHRINSYIGASCVLIMLEAIWPNFRTYPNSLASSSGIASNKMIAYFVFWSCKSAHYCHLHSALTTDKMSTLSVQFPLLLIHPRKMRWLFFVKSICAIVAAFAMLGWAVKTGGANPIFSQPSSLSGSAKSWAWMYSINVAVSGKTTLALNIVSPLPIQSNL